MPRFFGQRWRYEIGNSTVFVDNAYTPFGWCKERVVVNAEEVQAAFARGTFYRKFSEPWLTSDGEGHLTVVLKSGLMAILCSARLDDVELSPVDALKATWAGDKRSWPAEAEWQSTPR